MALISTSIKNSNLSSIVVIACLFLLFINLSSCSQIKPINTQHNFAETGLQTIDTLDVYAEGNIIHALLSGMDKKSQAPALRYINSLDAGKTWSLPVTVNKNLPKVIKSKRGNDFQVAAHGDKIMAIWQTQGGEPWSGILSAALSLDQGRTWNKIPSPVENKYSKINQGYFDITADLHGTFHITWLDDREEAGDTQGLRYASFQYINKDSTWTYHNDLEATSCTCCWSSITADKKGNIHVLFRDDNPRDMMIISSFDAGKSWKKANPVWAFGWNFVGCPHQGGGVATTQNNDETILHSVVWNGNESNRGLYYNQSKLNNEALSPIVSLGDETSASGDIAVIDNKQIGVVYTTSTTENTNVMTKLSLDGGKSWQKEQRLTSEGAEPTHPRIIGTNDGFRFFWTEWLENGNAMLVMSELKN
ncbi:MAG: glycoside hydrolase [Methylococcaceae bacterium]|nr:glycoside hydrolase [Methylococcaceae bacterium]